MITGLFENLIGCYISERHRHFPKKESQLSKRCERNHQTHITLKTTGVCSVFFCLDHQNICSTTNLRHTPSQCVKGMAHISPTTVPVPERAVGWGSRETPTASGKDSKTRGGVPGQPFQEKPNPPPTTGLMFGKLKEARMACLALGLRSETTRTLHTLEGGRANFPEGVTLPLPPPQKKSARAQTPQKKYPFSINKKINTICARETLTVDRDRWGN